MSKEAYDNLWTYFADTMEWAWTTADNSLERNNKLAMANIDAASRAAVAQENSSSAMGTALGGLVGTLGSAWIKGSFGI